MSPAHVLEPTYANLKQRLLQGTWPIGKRLDAAKLADEFGVSVTPVRDCLNRLVGEHLVDFRPQEGYRVVQLTEQTLRDLLDFNAVLLAVALTALRTADSRPDVNQPSGDYADDVSAICAAIATMAGNAILEETVAGLNDRLHMARSFEPVVLPGAAGELADLASLLARGSDGLPTMLEQFHRRRQAAVPKLIRLMQLGPK